MKKFVLSILSMLLLHGLVLACGCPDASYTPVSLSDYNSATHIFEGTLERVERGEKGTYGKDMVYFKINKHYKGKFKEEVGIRYLNDYYLGLKEGDQYIIYVEKSHKGEPAIEICSHSRNLSAYKEQLAKSKASIEQSKMKLGQKDLTKDELIKVKKTLKWSENNLANQKSNLAYEYKLLNQLKKDRNSATEIYLQNGELYAKGKLKNGLQTGVWKFYYQDILTSEENYKAGKKHGTVTSYNHSTGNISGLMEYSQGLLNGKQMRYYPDGTLSSETNYINGKVDGIHVRYDKEGQVKSKVRYADGKVVENISRANG